MPRADHAQADAVSEAATAEPIAAAGPLEIERRALQGLLPDCPADRHAELVAIEFGWGEAVGAGSRDATRLVPRQDAQTAQGRSAQARGAQRALQIARLDLAGPPRLAGARVV